MYTQSQTSRAISSERRWSYAVRLPSIRSHVPLFPGELFVQQVPDFIPGRRLNEYFFIRAVAPILERHFPSLRYGAGRLGTGSEVLGFDTPQSRDHDWGPRVTLFLQEDHFSADLRASISDIMANELPFEIDGYPTHFESPEIDGGHMAHTDARPIVHKVRVTTARSFLLGYLGVDPLLQRQLTPTEWLAIPEQHLRTVTSGPVFRDDLGELECARTRLQWYPRDVWLYVLLTSVLMSR
jgi:hypothetical protein